MKILTTMNMTLYCVNFKMTQMNVNIANARGAQIADVRIAY